MIKQIFKLNLRNKENNVKKFFELYFPNERLFIIFEK